MERFLSFAERLFSSLALAGAFMLMLKGAIGIIESEPNDLSAFLPFGAGLVVLIFGSIVDDNNNPNTGGDDEHLNP